MEIVVQKRSDFITIADDIAFVFEKLTKSENEILALSIPTEDNLKIKHTDLLTLAATISNTVNIRLGLKKREKPDEIIFLNTIEKDCNKFPELTSGEILMALEMGLDGIFGQDKDIFFNSSVFVRWIRAYIEQTKKPVIAKHAQLLHQVEEPKPEPSIKESLESRFLILKQALITTIEGSTYKDYGGILYDFLEKLGYLPLTSEQKWQAMDMAKLIMLSDAQDQNDKLKIKSVMSMIQDYESGIKHDAIAVTAKRWIVSEKLKEIVKDGHDDVVDFLDNVAVKITEYLEEHDFTGNK